MDSIKINRKEYVIEKGDYILYNGSCYQFYAGDNRTLKMSNHSSLSYIRIPTSVITKINLNDLQSFEFMKGSLKLKKWILK